MKTEEMSGHIPCEKNGLMDLDHIERCETSPGAESDKSRSHLKLHLQKDYETSNISKTSISSSCSPRSMTKSKVVLTISISRFLYYSGS